MTLSNTQQAQVKTWLEHKNLGTNCPMCADIAWEYAELVQAVPYAAGEIVQHASHTAHPMIQAVCTNCGYILLLSARVIGLISAN